MSLFIVHFIIGGTYKTQNNVVGYFFAEIHINFDMYIYIYAWLDMIYEPDRQMQVYIT